MSARQDGRQNCIALKSREYLQNSWQNICANSRIEPKTDHNLKIEIKNSNHAWCALIGLHTGC